MELGCAVGAGRGSLPEPGGRLRVLTHNTPALCHIEKGHEDLESWWRSGGRGGFFSELGRTEGAGNC